MLATGDLPKGARKVLQLKQARVLLFWYRSDIFAIESRSPAEGAYSQGFLNARFTQDGAIECPSTGSTFDLKTGAIKEWYPNNAVLRKLTPKDTCRPMKTYGVKQEEDVIYVDAAGIDATSMGAAVDGGAQTSLENNNVFAVEPEMYLEDGTAIEKGESALGDIQPATLILIIVATGIVAVAGTAVCLYYENIVALGAFWLIGFGLAAAGTLSKLNK